MKIRLVQTLVAAAVAANTAACRPAEQPPDLTHGAPVVNRQGDVVGTADPQELDRAATGEADAEVYRDGELVGHFGRHGFVPIH